VLGLVSLVFFAASYTWLMWPHPASQGAQARARSRISFLLFIALSLLVLVFSLVYGPAWLWCRYRHYQNWKGLPMNQSMLHVRDEEGRSSV
jgi:hypothetical protein